MRAKFRSILSAKTVKLKVRAARDAPEEDQEVELVAVLAVATHEAAAVPITLSSRREIAHLEKREPTTMVTIQEATVTQLMAEARENESAAPAEVKDKKKVKMIEKMEESENTPEEMVKEDPEKNVHRQKTIETLTTPTREVLDEEDVEVVETNRQQKDTAAIDKTIEEVKIDHAAAEAEAMTVKLVNHAVTTEDVVEDPLLMVSPLVRTVDSVEEEAVMVPTTVEAKATAAAEAEEAAVAVKSVAEEVPLMEKETIEVLR